MTSNISETSRPDRTDVQRRERFRRLMDLSIGVGVTGFIAATAIWVLFVPEDILLYAGLGIYYLGYTGHILIWQLTSVTLFDEREHRIERKTGGVVMSVVLFITIVGIPTDVVLAATGALAVPDVVRGAIYGYFLLTIGYILVYGYVSRKLS